MADKHRLVTPTTHWRPVFIFTPGVSPSKFIPHAEASVQKVLDNKWFGKVFVDFCGACRKITCTCFVSVYESVRRHRHMLKQKLCVRHLGMCARIQTGYDGGCQCFILDETSSLA